MMTNNHHRALDRRCQRRRDPAVLPTLAGLALGAMIALIATIAVTLT